MAANIALDIEQLLECPICLGEFEDPRVLPCLHSLCLKCLTDYVRTDAVKNQFNCPTCRHGCHLPAGGAAALPRHFMLNSLKAIKEAQGGTTKARSRERVCSNNNKGGAPHTPPTVFCVECNEFYCSNCEASHRMFGISSRHRLRPAGELGPMDVPATEPKSKRPNCDKHPGQPVDIYCDTCQVPVCASCCHLSHRQHKHRDLNEVAREAKVGLDYSKVKADKIEKRFDEHLHRLDLSERQINEDGNEVCQQIKREADGLRAAITKQEQALIQKVQTSQKAAVTDVRGAYDKTELNKVAARSIKSYIQALQTSGDAIDHVTHSPGIHEQLRQLDSVPQQLVSWNVSLKRDNQSVASLGSILGTVSVDKTVAPSGVVDSGMRKVLGDPVLSLKPNIGPQGSTISGLAVVGECVYVTGWKQPNLWIHNIKTNTKQIFTIEHMQAVGMTAVGKHNNTHKVTSLVIADFNNKLIFLTVCPQTIKSKIQEIPFQPCRVSLDPGTGKLIIANTTDKQIVVCDCITGKIENRLTVKTSIGDLRCAMATSDGYIVVDRSDEGRVHWVTKRGDVIHTYGKRDVMEKLYNPAHVISDTHGLLLVTDDDNHRIHLIDANRRLSHYILVKKDDFQYPYCVCLDMANRRLYVGHWDRRETPTVSVYTWPYTPIQRSGTLLRVQLKRYT